MKNTLKFATTTLCAAILIATPTFSFADTPAPAANGANKAANQAANAANKAAKQTANKAANDATRAAAKAANDAAKAAKKAANPGPAPTPTK